MPCVAKFNDYLEETCLKGSAVSRIMNVSIASGLSVVVSIGSQLLLVPVYLRYWSAEQFGAWLGVETCLILFAVLGMSYQDFVGSRFLQCDRSEIGRQLSAAIVAALLNAGCMVTCAMLLVSSGFLLPLVGIPKALYVQFAQPVELAFLCGIAAYAIGPNIFGTVDRAIVPLGYNPTAAWAACGIQFASAATPAFAVCLGGDLLSAALASGVAKIVLGTLYLFHICRILNRESVVLARIGWQSSLSEFLKAQVLTLKFLADRVRQDGSRLIVAPIIGSAGLASFSTIRTGANIIMQSMNSISRPVFPELMRYIRVKDQLRIEFCFSVIWLTLVTLVIPGTICLQLLVKPLFSWWTLGRLHFDATLFATASLSGLVSAYALPAYAVLRGNNLVYAELISTAISGSIMLTAVFALVPSWGLAGAGWALLLSECTSVLIVVPIARQWLNRNHLQWPQPMSVWALAALAVSAFNILTVAWLPTFGLPVTLGCFPVYLAVCYKFWCLSPSELRARFRTSLWLVLPDILKKRYQPSCDV